MNLMKNCEKKTPLSLYQTSFCSFPTCPCASAAAAASSEESSASWGVQGELD
jgi:hypothetical protein